MIGTYPGLKTEALKVFSVGYTIQRCLLERHSCKVFTNAVKMKMLSDVYMYKQLKNCQQVLGVIEERSEGFKQSKERLNDLRMSDLFDLV